MERKVYNILLDQKLIGTSNLEKHDAPMGVAFGEVVWALDTPPYEYLKGFSEAKGIKPYILDEDIKFIGLGEYPMLQVFDQNGKQIQGNGLGIEGMQGHPFEVSILGIPYPFYEEEFPHHVEHYNQMFD